jgi:hypothetical protein
MSTQSNLPTHRVEKRKVFILRIWPHGRDELEWVGEVQDVSTGETVHTQNLEALFDLLRQKTTQQMLASTEKTDRSVNTPEEHPVKSDELKNNSVNAKEKGKL